MTRSLRTGGPWAAALAVWAAAFGAGCTDRLNEQPKSFITTGQYYQTPSDVTTATYAAYAPIQDAYNFWYPILMDLSSDQTRIQPDEPNFQTYAPGLLLWTSTSSSIGSAWGNFFQAVFRANVALDAAGRVQFSDAAAQTALVAEAKFIRAYAYLQLTKGYGDVPLLLSLADHAKATTIPRSPAEQVQQQIIKDLNDAEAGLPATPPGDGRASKAAAQMALADLYQWRSSFLGKGEWASASAAAKRVIDSGNWQLMSDYLQPFLPAVKGYPANKEVILAIPSSGVNNASSFNTFCLFLPRSLGFGQNGGCEVIGEPTGWMYASFPKTVSGSDTTWDYRHDVTYRTKGCSLDPKIGCITLGNGSGPWPNVYKYRPTNQGVGGPTDNDYPLYRYSEALLVYAEAQYELGNGGEAINAINQIRARARQGTGGQARAEPRALTAVTRDTIFMERNWELGHEGKRWYDLVRRDTEDPGYFAAQISAHDPEVVTRGDLSAFRKRFPIPANEIQLDPALTQNPGY